MTTSELEELAQLLAEMMKDAINETARESSPAKKHALLDSVFCLDEVMSGLVIMLIARSDGDLGQGGSPFAHKEQVDYQDAEERALIAIADLFLVRFRESLTSSSVNGLKAAAWAAVSKVKYQTFRALQVIGANRIALRRGFPELSIPPVPGA